MWRGSKGSDDVSGVEDSEGVLRVTIRRPERRNALSFSVLSQLEDIFTEAAHSATVRLAVLEGAGGKSFASGGDLVELDQMRSDAEARRLSLHGRRALNSVRQFPLPVVAAINGVALGGGAELALACDIRFASSNSSIGLIHARLNIAPSWGGGVDFMQLVGPRVGLRHLARGEPLSSEEALKLGLVDAVAPEGADFEVALQAYVHDFRARPAQVMRAIKSLAQGERGRARSDLDAMETDQFVKVWTHADHWSAVDALKTN